MCLKSKSTLLSCIVMILSFSSIYPQNFVDKEVDDLAKELASKLDGKNQFLKPKKRITAIIIEDFTDTENKVSKLGASLSEELSLALANAAMSFTVTTVKDYEKSSRSGGLNPNKLWNGLEKLVDGAIDDRDYEKNRKSREAFKAIDGASEVGSTITQKRKNYKGIDAVVTGTLTESNDQFGILVKVISQTKGNPIFASVKGFVSKTPFILQLEEEENRRKANPISREEFTARGSSSTSSMTGVPLPFTSNHTKVELLEARQVGQNIECRFRITNTGADVNFALYGKNSGGKIIDSNNSFDYWAVQLQMGELMNNSYVQKTLVTNNPVEAKVTFGGVPREVSKIAKLSVKCLGHGGQFWIEFRDVFVD